MGWTRYTCCSPPNTPLRCHSAGEPFSPSSNTTPKLSLAVSIPAYARSSHSAGGVAQPCWMMMKTRRRTLRPHTPLYTTWLGKRRAAKAKQPPSKWRPLEEVWHGSWLPKWTSVRRSLRPWRKLMPTGGHSSGCKWWPKG